MSYLFINQYYKQIETIIRRGGNDKEQSIKVTFLTLLNNYCSRRNFTVVAEL